MNKQNPYVAKDGTVHRFLPDVSAKPRGKRIGELVSELPRGCVARQEFLDLLESAEAFLENNSTANRKSLRKAIAVAKADQASRAHLAAYQTGELTLGEFCEPRSES